MTSMTPEREDVTFPVEEIDVPCDGPRIWAFNGEGPTGKWEHGPARWVMLKECGHHRLICEKCRQHFLNGIALGTAWACWIGKVHRADIKGFEPLQGRT